MLRFKGTDLRPILEEAKANGCKVILVKDQGVYMMSAIGEKDSHGTHKRLAYAIGCNPNVDDFDEWWTTSERELGGDDFGEYFDLTTPVFAKLLNSTDDLIVRASKTHIHLETAPPLSDPPVRVTPKLPERQLKFLAERLGAAIARQPELADLRRTLLTIGGVQIVVPASDDRDVPLLLSQGHIMAGPITVVEMQASHCHANVARLWLQRYPGLLSICTGYALSDDGLWRQHSWGLLEHGIVETTISREVYFGIVYGSVRSDHFARANAPSSQTQPS